MTSWVRYSVAVYVGLLLAGAVVVPEPLAAAGGWMRALEPQQPEAVERLDMPQDCEYPIEIERR